MMVLMQVYFYFLGTDSLVSELAPHPPASEADKARAFPCRACRRGHCKGQQQIKSTEPTGLHSRTKGLILPGASGRRNL